MKLYYETVSPVLLNYLSRLMEAGPFKDFYLVGGTALALQLGHRMSVDIDLFTNQLYGKIDRESLRDCICRLFPYVDNPDCLNEDQMVY